MANKNKPITQPENTEFSEVEKAQKIQSLHEMISSAEKTIQSAKAMLLALEGKKKIGRRRKIGETEDGKIIQGTFDGQVMIGTDAKQYPVPANYASKSKLVEGDLLKLTITSDGSFIYKQIGPVERKRLIGIASQDERGNYYVLAEGKPYRVLLASVTYFRVEPGDEVTIIIPRDIESSWAAIDNVLQKAKEKIITNPKKKDIINLNENEKEIDLDEEINKWQKSVKNESSNSSLIDEWSTDIDEIEKEIKNNNTI